MNLHRLLRAAESARALDRPADAVAVVAKRLPVKPGVRRALRGSWLGHPLHPLMITVPIGAWLCSAVLDLVPGNEHAARKLVGIGLAAVPPTVLLGAVDYVGLERCQRRVEVAHALTNTAAVVLFAASYAVRKREAQGKGKLLGFAGVATLSTGGAFGGHLAHAQGAGVHRWQSADGEPLSRPVMRTRKGYPARTVTDPEIGSS
jgi:hypothetical protein